MKRCRLPIMPPPLSLGDCVGIAAPASHIPRGNEEFLHRGAERVREMGFAVRYSPSLLKRKHLYLAGTDEERAQELMEMFLDPEVKAILCSRGGYGVQRIIPYLDADLIREHPKPLVGCSDITVLLIYLLQRCFVVPFHGPNVATRQFVEGDAEMAHALKGALTAPLSIAEIACSVLREGKAQGEIIGGCLSCLVTTLGTPYEPDLQGKVFFVEDVDEPPYKIDRMLTHLKSAGKLQGVKGVVFGQMPGCDTEKGLLHEVIPDVLEGIEGPILFGFPSGHGARNLTFPLGVLVRIQGGVVSIGYNEVSCFHPPKVHNDKGCLSQVMLKKGAHCYFIGIGGIAMAQAALLLNEMGYQVRGSDSALHPPTDRLLQKGKIAVEQGYDAAHLSPPPDLVVIGNSVSRGNPEVEAVLDQGIPYTSLPGLIEEGLLRERRSVVVAGTHGKTTTASLLAWLLFSGGVDPSFMVGGMALNFGQGYRLGHGEWTVLEGDEYDSAFFDKGPKFLHYLPQVVILSSIEYDHADIYKNLEEVKGAFRQLLAIIPKKGTLIANTDDEVVREMISGARCRVETFGGEGRWSPKGVRTTPEGTAFLLQRGGEDMGEFTIPLWGEHNVSNAVGAVVAASLIGLSFAQIREGLRTFQGVRRRMEVVGETRGITVIDDFAHHPTAIRETLRAARVRFPEGRLWAIFEPRSQTMRRDILQGELTTALKKADHVVIGRIFSPPSQGEIFDPQRVVQEIRKAKGDAAASYLEAPEEIVAHCVEGAAPGDVIVVMSSGHFEGLPERIFTALRNRS